MSDSEFRRHIIGPGRRYFDEWSPVFLAALRATGNIQYACDAAGVTRRGASYARQTNAEFDREWRDALETATDALELEARKRALAGSDQLLMFMLKANRPAKFRERIQVDHRLIQRLAAEYEIDESELQAEIDAMIAEVMGGGGDEPVTSPGDEPIEAEFTVSDTPDDSPPEPDDHPD